MLICGQEFEFSLMNANDLDRFEDANEQMQRRSARSRSISGTAASVWATMHVHRHALPWTASTRSSVPGASDRLGLNENYMAPIYDVIEELGNAFSAEKQRYAAKPAQPMNREQRRAQAKKNRHKPPVSYPAPPAARMVERVDAQVSAKQKTEQLIDARQAVNALRDDPDAMQQLAEYALRLASERHV